MINLLSLFGNVIWEANCSFAPRFTVGFAEKPTPGALT
jgi:hypothetical protein